MKISFYIPKRDLKAESATIRVRCYINGTKFCPTTGIKINPKHWDSKSGMVNYKEGNIGQRATKTKELNAELEQFRVELATFFDSTIQSNPDITKSAFQTLWNSRQRSYDTICLIDYFLNDFIHSHTVGKTGHLLDQKTIDTYISSIKTVILYHDLREQGQLGLIQSKSEVYRRIRGIDLIEFGQSLVHQLTLDELNDQKFLKSLITWLQKIGYSPDSCGNRVKHIKTILTDAHEEDIISSFNVARVSKPSVEKDPVTLSNDDVAKIIKLNDLSEDELIIKDLMLFAIFTGLRKGDLLELENEHIRDLESEDAYLFKLMQKNRRNKRKQLYIPLHPVARSIIIKNGRVPDLNPVKNTFIKKMRSLCRKAGINSMLESVDIESGKTSFLKISDIITLHDLRKTWSTLAIDNEWASIDQVAEIFRHSSDSTTLHHYVSERQKRATNVMSKNIKKNPLFSY